MLKRVARLLHSNYECIPLLLQDGALGSATMFTFADHVQVHFIDLLIYR